MNLFERIKLLIQYGPGVNPPNPVYFRQIEHSAEQALAHYLSNGTQPRRLDSLTEAIDFTHYINKAIERRDLENKFRAHRQGATVTIKEV